MHHIFKKNYNLIIKNFIPMCLRREQHCSAVSFTHKSRQTPPYRETVLQNKIQPYLRCQ